MPDAEKIIARKIDKILGRNGFGSDYTQGELDGWGSEIAAALREAGMLTETEWEYGAGYQADNGIEMRWFSMGSGAFTIREAAEREVERFSDAQIRVVRRRKPGPWEPVPEEAADA